MFRMALFAGSRVAPHCPSDKWSTNNKQRMEQWCNYFDKNHSEINLSHVTVSTIKHAWTSPVLKLILREERPVTKRIDHDKATEY
jgi:ferritin